MFQRTNQNPPQTPTDYPPGTFIKTEAGYFYITKDRKRYRILTRRILDSWSPPRVVESTEAAVKRYRVVGKMKFRNGSLIHNIADGKVYLIVHGKRCPMVSPEAYERIGAERSRRYIVSVSLAEIELHELGEEIS